MNSGTNRVAGIAFKVIPCSIKGSPCRAACKLPTQREGKYFLTSSPNKYFPKEDLFPEISILKTHRQV